jgi:enoyl-CoA hydratase
MNAFEKRADQPTSSDQASGEEAAQAEPVKTERHGSIWVVTINRPATRNAVNRPTSNALTKAFEYFEQDTDMTVAILTGAGGTFCSGADLQALAQQQIPLNEDISPLGLARLRLSKPCLAAIEGYALAGGFEIALWCDLRVAAPNALFGIAHHRWGIPSMDGATVLLPRLIGQSRALDLLLTGRTITGEEAYGMGLVNRLATSGSVLETALTLANEIARFPQPCLRADRLSAYQQWTLPYQDALRNEAHNSLHMIQAEEREAILRRLATR